MIQESGVASFPNLLLRLFWKDEVHSIPILPNSNQDHNDVLLELFGSGRGIPWKVS